MAPLSLFFHDLFALCDYREV